MQSLLSGVHMLQPCPPSVQPAPQLTLHRTRRLRRLRRAVLCQRGGPSAPAQPSRLADSRMDLNGCQPPQPAHLQLPARDGHAAARRAWRQQELPKAERPAGTPGRSRLRLWRSLVAARLWRHAGRDTRSLRPLFRAFALDSAQQLQARLLCLALSAWECFTAVDRALRSDAGACDLCLTRPTDRFVSLCCSRRVRALV